MRDSSLTDFVAHLMVDEAERARPLSPELRWPELSSMLFATACSNEGKPEWPEHSRTYAFWT